MAAPHIPFDSTPLRREIGAVVRLATPVVVVQVGMMLMGVVDTMMLGRVSESALAAGALGNGLGMGLSIFPMGILMALDPLVAQAFGAGDHRRVGTRLQQGLVLALVISVPWSLLMWQIEGFLRWTGQDLSIVGPTRDYVRAIIPGTVALLLFVAGRQTLQAMSLVRPAVIAILVANVANGLGNYALIFGNLGFPALGVLGSGFATSLSRVLMLGTLFWAGWPVFRRYARHLPQVWSRRGYLQVLKIGIPSGFQMGLEAWLFVAVTVMMGSLGPTELAAHQIAINLASLTFMVPLGISGAAATRVGNAIGRGDASGARWSAGVCLVLGTLAMVCSALIFWFLPRPLSRLYTPEEGVLAIAVTLIPIAAIFQIVDGIQVVAGGALRGSADTRIPALIALVGFWGLGLPLGWTMAFDRGLGAPGLWWGLTGGLASAALLLMTRLVTRFKGPLLGVVDSDA